MPKRRCENCSHWSSTDSVWGNCFIASTNGQWRNEAKRACASYVASLGDVQPADLETRADFGCVEWKSLTAVIKRIAAKDAT